MRLLLRSISFAWIDVVRQPARTALGILGVAAIGALLFDMLLLSRGLVVSFRDLLDRAGFDVRVLATDAPPFTGPRIPDATAVARQIAGLPQVEAVLQLRVRRAEIVPDTPAAAPSPPDAGDASMPDAVEFIGAEPQARPMWTMVEGRDLPRDPGAPPTIVINRNLARRAGLRPGARLSLRGRCAGENEVLPPVAFAIAGIADFPFDDASAGTVAGRLVDVPRLCGDEPGDLAELLLVRSSPGTGASEAARAIRRLRPELHVVTNDDLVERFSRVEFSYFRQISVVLATVTLFFGFLLIGVLLTVSVNQRLGEIAALRAVGLSRARVLAGVLFESVFLVGAGGVLAVPLGLGLSVWLDDILRAMPGVPADLRFFVFEPRALALHVSLLSIAAVAAAAYPMRIVATLPIAATLRREVIS